MRTLTALTVALVLATLTANVCHGQISAGDYRTIMGAQSDQGRFRELQYGARVKGEALFGIDSLDIETSKWVEDHGSSSAGALKVGDWGYSEEILKVISVVSPTEVLVLPTNNNKEPVLVRGLTTEKVTNGNVFILLHPFVIEGTYKYEAVSGASKTVLVLDTSKFADRLKEAQDAAEEALYKPWMVEEEEVEAKYAGYAKGLVTLVRKVDGVSVETPISGLGKKDQDWVRGEIKRAAAEKVAKSKADKAKPVGGTKVSDYKRFLATQQSGQKVDATAKIKNVIAAVDAGRTRWLNETHNDTVRWVKDKVWEEVDNETGQVNYTYQETSRHKDYIEVFCPKRDLHIRLQAKSMETKQGDKWSFVASGKWDAAPRSEPKVDATGQNKGGIAEVDAVRTRWLNETYDNTISMVKAKVWEEVDNKTGKPGFTYQEVARNKDYIEIFCPKRDFHIRLQAKTLELKTGADGKWGWLAHGKWDAVPRSEPKADVTGQNKGGIAEVDAVRTRWLNETYDNTISMVKAKVWQEVDNKTGKVSYTYQETSRNKDYVEIFCSKRDFHLRLQAKTLELKKGADGKWGWLAHGKWDVTPAKP